ncbi:MAG TPA: hypothetical protein VG406_25435 [Isosphaeraceae bacterium]|nr:hypothetical protein [Isosphaeraceae bacterium]
MFRPSRSAPQRAATTLVAALLLAGPARGGADDAPAKKPAGDGPTAIVVGTPDDLAALWRRLSEADWVLLKGPEYRRLLERLAPAPAARPAGPGVTAVEVRGEVHDDRAFLTVALGIDLDRDDPAWVPIRLDGQPLTRAREGPAELPVKHGESGAWEVELRGRGRHAVEVTLPVPVRLGPDGHQLDLAIPEAASTRLDLTVGPGVVEAVVGARGRVEVEPVEGGHRTRLSAHLPPRSALDVSWKLEDDPGRNLPPLLTAQGEIALEIDRAGCALTASWLLRAERGTTRSLRLTLDPAEELLELRLDDRPLTVEDRRAPGTATVTVPLDDPIRPGADRRLVVKARRPLPTAPPARWAFRGLPLAPAVEQRGLIAVGQGEGLWVGGVAGRGLRQIDPRGELPDHLRGPATVLGYQFLDQPFELALRVDPAPPRVRVGQQTAVTIAAGQARVESWLEYQITRGRAFEARVELPAGLVLDAVGPEEVIESFQRLAGGDGPRVLAVRLRAGTREAGGFRLHLTGHQPLDPSGRVGLFRASDAVSTGGKVAVLAARDLVVEPADDARAAGFAPIPPRSPADWPFPADRSASAPVPACWLRHDDDPAALPLRVVVQPRAVHHETSLTAVVGRQGLDARQETTCHVRHGTLTRLDVAVPPAIEGRWALDGLEVVGKSRLADGPDGAPRYRLTLGREVVDQARLRFRYHLPIDPPLGPTRSGRVELPAIRVLEGTASPTRTRVAADAEVDLEPDGPGWERLPAEPAAADAPAPRLETVRPADAKAPAVLARAAARAKLPALVASRLWLRTTQGAEGDLRGTAWYRVEIHDATLAVALPTGARLIRARVGGAVVNRAERLADGGYRLRFPAALAAGPVLVALDYQVPGRATAGAWDPPRLLEGGVVEETLWEVRLPWNRALIGVPAGWTDENRWAWAGYVFKRRPWQGPEALAGWVAGPTGRAALADEPGDDGFGGSHSYLFGRPDTPAPARPWIASRAVLVAVCSGAVLALGLAWLAWRPRLAWIGPLALAMAATVAAAADLSATALVVQSSALGVALTALAALTRHLVDRRRHRHAFGEPSGLGAATGAGPGSSRHAALVGSDDSTVLRHRPASTVDRPGPSQPVPSATGSADGPGAD